MAFSYVTDVGDGSTRSFVFSFEGQDEAYIRTEDIVAFVDDVEASFTLLSSNTLEFLTAPPDGSEVLIRRVMPKNVPFTDFEGGNNFGQTALNNSFLQMLYIVHELLDGWFPEDFVVREAVNFLRDITISGDLSVSGTLSDFISDQADPNSAVNFTEGDDRYVNKSGDTMDGSLNLALNKIVNLGTPTNPNDAARLRDIQSAIVGGSANLISFEEFEEVQEETVQGAIEFLHTQKKALEATLQSNATGGDFLGTSTASGQGSVNDALNKRAIYTASIDTLKTLDVGELSNGQQVIVFEYASGSGAGGGIFYWDATSEEAPNLGQVFQVDGVPTGRWKRKEPAKRPEDWGAFGDNTVDDTNSVKAWWESDEPVIAADGHYLISGTEDFVREVDAEDFYAALGASRFNVTEPRAYLLRADIVTGGRIVWVDKGVINANNNVARGLNISTDEGISARTVIVKDTKVNEIFANSGLSYSSSAIGISISCEASQVFVNRAYIGGVNRDYVNPGSVASIGISVSKITGSASITDCAIIGIQSPDGDADADGISMFSRDRLLVGRQNVKVKVQNNRINNCKGRFVKLQTTGAEVSGNSFRSTSGEIISSFRAVDCQFGGCNVHDNFWNLYSGVTGGGEAVFCLSRAKQEGNFENLQIVRNNEIILERELRYLFSCTLDGGESRIEVVDNHVYQTTSTAVLQNLTRLDATDITAVESCSIKVKDNTYVSESDEILQLVGADFSGNAATADILSVELVSNTNTATPSSVTNRLVLVAATDQVPHLNKVILRDNNTGGDNRLDAKSMNINTLPAGNDFYYGTDGGSGGLLNTPSGYNRFRHVKTEARVQRLTGNNSGTFAQRTEGNSTWYEYTGTAL